MGVAASVAFSLLVTRRPTDSLMKLLEAEPSSFVLLLGAAWARLVNDIAAGRGWDGFEETRMFAGDEESPIRTPVSQPTKIFFVYPLFVAIMSLVLIGLIGKH
jgi:hypothetical protein